MAYDIYYMTLNVHGKPSCGTVKGRMVVTQIFRTVKLEFPPPKGEQTMTVILYVHESGNSYYGITNVPVVEVEVPDERI